MERLRDLARVVLVLKEESLTNGSDPAGQFFVTLMAFGLEAKSTITQVLFFKAKATEARLRYYSGRVTINTDVLDGVRSDIKAKLTSHVSDYVKALPDVA